jgi:hypothetical protein
MPRRCRPATTPSAAVQSPVRRTGRSVSATASAIPAWRLQHGAKSPRRADLPSRLDQVVPAGLGQATIRQDGKAPAGHSPAQLTSSPDRGAAWLLAASVPPQWRSGGTSFRVVQPVGWSAQPVDADEGAGRGRRVRGRRVPAATSRRQARRPLRGQLLSNLGLRRNSNSGRVCGSVSGVAGNVVRWAWWWACWRGVLPAGWVLAGRVTTLSALGV